MKITRTNFEKMRDDFKNWLEEVYESHNDCLTYTFDVFVDDDNIVDWDNGTLMNNEYYIDESRKTIYSLKGWDIEEQLHNDFGTDYDSDIKNTLEMRHGKDVEERDDYDDLYDDLYNELLENHRDDYYDYYIFECDLPQFDDLDIDIED